MEVKYDPAEKGGLSVRFPEKGVTCDDMDKAGYVAEMAYRLRHNLGTFSPEVREVVSKMII